MIIDASVSVLLSDLRNILHQLTSQKEVNMHTRDWIGQKIDAIHTLDFGDADHLRDIDSHENLFNRIEKMLR